MVIRSLKWLATASMWLGFLLVLLAGICLGVANSQEAANEMFAKSTTAYAMARVFVQLAVISMNTAVALVIASGLVRWIQRKQETKRLLCRLQESDWTLGRHTGVR